MSALTIDMLRVFMGDMRSQMHENRSGDLQWTDEELQAGLEYAARAYNSVPPGLTRITADQLDASSNLFFNGAAAGCLQMRLNKMYGEQQVFEAGGIATAPDKAIIEGFEKAMTMYKREFMDEARQRKNEINMRKGVGIIW